MSLYRVSESNQRGASISSGNTYYDARTRPWFKVAVSYNRAHWYPVYRYVINDSHGAYDAVGIGMSAPLYSGAGEFVGVMTADVALVQLSPRGEPSGWLVAKAICLTGSSTHCLTAPPSPWPTCSRNVSSMRRPVTCFSTPFFSVGESLWLASSWRLF